MARWVIKWSFMLLPPPPNAWSWSRALSQCRPMWAKVSILGNPPPPFTDHTILEQPLIIVIFILRDRCCWEPCQDSGLHTNSFQNSSWVHLPSWEQHLCPPAPQPWWCWHYPHHLWAPQVGWYVRCQHLSLAYQNGLSGIWWKSYGGNAKVPWCLGWWSPGTTSSTWPGWPTTSPASSILQRLSWTSVPDISS